MNVSRRRTAALLAGLLVAGLPAGAAIASETDSADGGCPVLATAVGLQITVSDSGNPAAPGAIGPAVPTAQACVNYLLRESESFASSPYPGRTLIQFPGRVLDGQPVTVPDYPAYVFTRFPGREKDEAEEAGFELAARSAETTSKASARNAAVGDSTDSGSTLSTAETTVDPAAGTSAAVAKADVHPLAINDVLELGRVRSEATATHTSAGKIERNSRLEIGRTRVAGQEVVFTPDGVKAAGQTVAVPGAEPADALREAGVGIRYLAAEETERGILSAGLEITARQRDDTGAVREVRYVVGRAFATAAPVDDGGLGAPDGSGVEPVTMPDSSGDSAGGFEGGSPPVMDSPDEPVSSGDVPEPAEAPEPADGPEVAEQDEQVVAAGPAALVGRPIDMGVAAAYLVLVFGAVAMFASGTLVRLLGVKTRWTS